MNWADLQNQTNTFSTKLQAALEQLGILEECKELEVDHICVRLRDSNDVTSLKAELEEAGQVLSSTVVNGREISIIQLNTPIDLGPWQTYGVELPYPKPSHSYEDGWEHVEFVLTNAENTMDGVRDAFFKQFPGLEQATLTSEYAYSEDEPHAEGDQMPNPTIGIKVNGIGLKFHANSIQRVVGYTD